MAELILGYDADNEGEPITLPLNKLTHTHFKGMTGQGKSSLLAYAAASLIQAGVGVALLDPAGDLSEQVLSLLVATGYFEEHSDALERVVYLPLELGHRQGRYIPFNVLSGDYDPYAAAGVVLEGFKRVWPVLQDGFAINIDTLVHLGSYVLSEHGLPLLPFLLTLYSKPEFYRFLVPSLHDDYIREQFETMKLEPINIRDKETGQLKVKVPELADTTIKRVSRLAVSPLVRYPLAQKVNVLDPAELLRAGRSVLINLGLSDPYAKTLIGALFTQAFEQTAKTFRHQGVRRPYVLIIDEVEEFVFQSGKALETMFAESRKAGVAVWVAHQYGAQLSDELNAALSQCATKVVFKVGYEDAVASVEQMGFPYDPYWVKEYVENASGQGRSVYFSEHEQLKLYAHAIMRLGVQEAYIQRPGYELTRMATFSLVNTPNIPRLEQLTHLYLDRYFRPISDIQHEVLGILQSALPSQPHLPRGTVEASNSQDRPLPKALPPPSPDEPNATAPPPQVEPDNQPDEVDEPGYDPLFDYDDGLTISEDDDDF